MSIRHNGKVIAGATQYHPDLFDWKWADHQLDDVQWLCADTFSWQAGSVYQAAYQHLADDITGKSLQSETISGTTIQFYLADDGHKICPASEESNVAAIYSATGVAWYYILDTVNQRFKLPRTKFGFTGIRSGVGKFVSAGLPNITGSYDYPHLNNTTTSSHLTGAMYIKSVGGDNRRLSSEGGSSPGGLGFDASRSSSVYGNSNTVQPKATEMYLYFYVGNFTQTALENTAGLNASLFNDKADIDFNNTNMIDYVVEKQDPTAGNNYTWYRKYKSGWVEQGGRIASGITSISLLIEMSDTEYWSMVNFFKASSSNNLTTGGLSANTQSTTGFTTMSSGYTRVWVVMGKAAN